MVPDRLFHTGDAWYEWRAQLPRGARVFVRVEPAPDGRLALTGLRIEGQLSAELLREIPVGRIEAAANAQLVVGQPAGAPVGSRPPASGPPGTYDDGWETAGGVLVERPVSRRRLRVGETEGRGRPDSFYEAVAAAYRNLARRSSRPAAELAEEHGVPVTTAHRWVKEARRRGFLAPGRPGKAG